MEEELVCDGSKQKDDDSIISERCWEEKYRGHSRKWILRDGSVKKSDPPVGSTMKDTYTSPEPDKPVIGARRAILERRLYDEVVEEILKEREEAPPVEEYCTEYDGNFSACGFVPEKIPERNAELNEKYPLYQSKPVTFWSFRLEKQTKGTMSLDGLSTPIDLENPFKKNCAFTKPLDEVLDESNAV